MCGIGGWFGPADVDPALASALVAALTHRGPDAHATRHLSRGSLAHTRLRIIDLTAAGAQPMSNNDGTVWVAFNGEIYNHHGLRHELEADGVHFRGRSDTEVLPYLYERHGPDFVQRL